MDIATAWVELEAVWGKGHERVGGGVQRVRQRLPWPLLGIDSDNGSEFINKSLYDYCQKTGVTFTRSRAWKKNDSAHVEQKNGAGVRQLIGYDRFTSKAAYAQLARVYRLARVHVNFFQPVQKLVSKRLAAPRVRSRPDALPAPVCLRRAHCLGPRRTRGAVPRPQPAPAPPRTRRRARSFVDAGRA